MEVMTGEQHPDPFSPATELAERIRHGEVTPTEAVEAYLDRIKRLDDELNVYTSVSEAEARQAAHDAEEALEEGEEVGPLHGVPIALKDLGFRRKGEPLPGVSPLFADSDQLSEDSAAVVERLEEAGAIVLGRTNVPEFGLDFVTDNDQFGPTLSPINPEYNAGGSSGGSAAAVGSGMAAVATGSDMGGSSRVPAAACGVFGFKPSYGLLPTDDRPDAFAGTTHHFAYGPLTRTVADAALLMDVMAGLHPRDPWSVPVNIDYRAAVNRPIDDLRVAYSPDLDVYPVADPIRKITEDASGALSTAGATVETVSVDHDLSINELASTLKTTGGVSTAHASEIIEQSMGISLSEHTDRLSASVRELLEIGEDTTRGEEAKADLVRAQFFDAVEDLFEEYDVLVTPTIGVPGFKSSPDITVTDRADQALTYPFNWTGHPASSVPAGLTDEGLPVGLQVIAPRYDDDIVLAVSAAVERERPWHGIYQE